MTWPLLSLPHPRSALCQEAHAFLVRRGAIRVVRKRRSISIPDVLARTASKVDGKLAERPFHEAHFPAPLAPAQPSAVLTRGKLQFREVRP